MYNKYIIVSKIGTILSFFLLGFGSLENLFKDTIISCNICCFHFNMPIKYLLYILLFVIFCGIFWSLRYCYKHYKSNDVDISFHTIKRDSKLFLELEIYNNLNLDIQISKIFFIHDHGGPVIFEPKPINIQIPSLCSMSPPIYFDSPYEKDKKLTVIIIYNFFGNKHNKGFGRKLTKKEIEIFKKLSTQ